MTCLWREYVLPPPDKDECKFSIICESLYVKSPNMSIHIPDYETMRVRRIPWDVDWILATAPPAVLQALAQIVGHQKLLEAIGGGVAQNT